MNGPRNKTLLAAVGNPLSGDDGFGAHVLERLRCAAEDLPPRVSLVDAGTDLLNHIESFAEYDRVVLMDAVLDPEGKLGLPGRVVAIEEESLQSWSEASEGVHQMSPLLGIRLFRVLYPEAQTRIHIIGLCVDRITHSPLYMTDERIGEAVSAVRALLSQS